MLNKNLPFIHTVIRIVTKKGGVKEVQYYHQFTAFILADPKISFILDIEPILPKEGEISSSYRLLG
ncbi:MAG: hypothetical protein KJ770_00480 [Actinobacteria bacterium]|nr:hypothetical protein [Actinomycetota bacterium]